jgi:hypothetical protein
MRNCSDNRFLPARFFRIAISSAETALGYWVLLILHNSQHVATGSSSINTKDLEAQHTTTTTLSPQSDTLQEYTGKQLMCAFTLIILANILSGPVANLLRGQGFFPNDSNSITESLIEIFSSLKCIAQWIMTCMAILAELSVVIQSHLQPDTISAAREVSLYTGWTTSSSLLFTVVHTGYTVFVATKTPPTETTETEQDAQLVTP